MLELVLVPQCLFEYIDFLVQFLSNLSLNFDLELFLLALIISELSNP